VAAIAVLAFSISFSLADDTAEQAKPGLHLKIPAGWKSRMRQPPAGDTKLPTAMQIDAREGSGAFSLKLTFFGNSPRKLTDDDVKKVAEAAAQQYIDKSVEKAVDLQELKNENFLGYYATFTEAAPKPGDFPAVTSLVARLGDGLMAVTIMHQKDSKNLPTALEMLRTATVVKPATQPATGAKAKASS